MRQGQEAQRSLRQQRILSLAFATRRMGFVVSYDTDKLLDWGVKIIPRTDKDIALGKVQKLIDHYQPDLILLQSVTDKDFKLGQAVQNIITGISVDCKMRKIRARAIRQVAIKWALGLQRPNNKQALFAAVQYRFDGLSLPETQKRTNYGETQTYAVQMLALALLSSLSGAAKAP